MTTVRTCTEPKDAWGLVSHFLGNNLLVVSGACEMAKEDASSIEKAETMISNVRANLAGNLYMLVRRMNSCGHANDASKIQQILDMVTDQDIANAEVRQAIHDKNREFNAGKREFEAAMEELRTKGAFQT